MESDEGASTYMETYGEGPGSDTRKTISQFIIEGESVLDVGCGPGWNIDHFMRHGPLPGRYKGIDYSERFVRVANERRETFAILNGQYPDKFELGDVRDLKEPEESWDVVLLQDVLEHTNGYEKSVADALRVARKRVIVTFWRMTDINTDTINDDGDDGYGAAYSRSKWEKYLDSLGYRWIYLRSEPEANRQHDFYIIYKESE